MTPSATNDAFTLYGQTISNRVLLGTARYPSLQALSEAIDAAQPGMLTLALRRVIAGGDAEEGFIDLVRDCGVPLLPNTAGCSTPKEAVTTAHMARELFETNWIKLELIGDAHTLQPDPIALLAAAEELVRAGFYVLPYCTEDLMIGRRLLDVGCQALMPWGAPIGSGKGIVNPFGLRLLRERLPGVALIVDAGLGVPSHACQVMEWGFDSVLVNTAVSRSSDPARMARAFSMATEVGRQAWLAGPMAPREQAEASTPVTGMPFQSATSVPA
jgi:thiazole synthase